MDFVVHFCTCSQTVFCDRQFFSVANYCTLLHRENGSFEVLSLQTNDEFDCKGSLNSVIFCIRKPGERSYESQSLLSAQAKMYDRTEKPVVCCDTSHEHRHHHRFVESTHSARYSEWDADKVWYSQEWKSDELMDDRTGKPVVCPQRGPQQFVIGDDETESELSLGSRSFLNRVNDQVRKRQKRSSMSETEDSGKHSVTWGMLKSSTLQSSVFMDKNYSDNWHSIKNTKDLTIKQMFDISEKLITEQSDEIYGISTIDWESSSWKYLSLIGDEQVISRRCTKVYVFSDSVLCLGKMNENTQSNIAWEERLGWFKSSQVYRTFDRIDGEPMELEWNIFPGFTTLQLCYEVQELLSRLNVKFAGRIIFMTMFNDISWGSKDNEKECESNAQLVSLYAKRFGIGQWSFLGPGSEKKC